LHGTFGEDGQVQKILEKRGVPYTGENVEGSHLAFDKIQTKEKFREHNIPTPNWQVIRSGQKPTIPIPIVIKVPRQGSTVGVYIIKTGAEIPASLEDGAKYDNEFLVEKFIAGRELTIGILGDLALPIIEIIPKGGFYDYTNKYPFLNPSAGGAAQHVCPANLPEEQTRAIQDLALRAHRSVGLKVYSRVDVILPEDEGPTVLEVNTIPGMTEASLLPEAAGVAGIDYPQLCARIIELSRAARREGEQ
jgi:D-alanine-D-alanine ligase